MRKALILLNLIFLSLLFSGCDSNRVFENYVSLSNDEWHLQQRPSFYIDVQDSTKKYNLVFCLRHTGNYKYANLFVLFAMQGPKMKAVTKRLEFKLAESDGRWLGSGLGDVYSNQIVIMEDVVFARKGVYSFGFEQNMRDNPLAGIEDVGFRLEEAGD